MRLMGTLSAVLLCAGMIHAQETATSTDLAMHKPAPLLGATSFIFGQPLPLFPLVNDPASVLQRIDWKTDAVSSSPCRFDAANVDPWQPDLSFPAAAATSSLPGPGAGSQTGQAPTPRPRAFVYSNGYHTRLKIHKVASYATLPLFAAELVVGQKLYNGDQSSSLRSAHSDLAAGIAVLFGINSVTGVWNMWDARKDPNGRGKRMFHGILMLGADAGFVATGALAPGGREFRLGLDGRGSAHRAVAISSMAVATVSYLYMLFAK